MKTFLQSHQSAYPCCPHHAWIPHRHLSGKVDAAHLLCLFRSHDSGPSHVYGYRAYGGHAFSKNYSDPPPVSLARSVHFLQGQILRFRLISFLCLDHAHGIIGFLMKRHGFGPALFVMGLILGKLVEQNLPRARIIFDNNWLKFIKSSIVDTFLVLTVLSLFWPLISKIWKRS